MKPVSRWQQFNKLSKSCDIQPSATDTDSPQREKLAHLGDHRGFTVAYEGSPLGLQRLDVCGEKADLLPGTLQTNPQGRWQGRTIPLPPLLKLGVHIALQHERHAIASQEPFDALDHPRPVTLCWRQFPVELPAIFLGHARHLHDTPDLLLTCYVAQQHRQELADSEPIGLRPALAPIDLNTGRIDDVVLDAMRYQVAV